MRFHHLGIACRDIQTAASQFKAIHAGARELTPIVHDREQQADLQLIKTEDGTCFEFVSGPVVSGLLARHVDLYHSCFETPDFDDQVTRFLKQKAIPLGPAKPAILFDNRRVIFLKTMFGIVELLEMEQAVK